MPDPRPLEDIDELVEELLAQAPALVTHEELASYKERAKALIDKAVVEELNRIWKTAVDNNVAGPVKWEIEDRIKELKEKPWLE